MFIKRNLNKLIFFIFLAIIPHINGMEIDDDKPFILWKKEILSLAIQKDKDLYYVILRYFDAKEDKEKKINGNKKRILSSEELEKLNFAIIKGNEFDIKIIIADNPELNVQSEYESLQECPLSLALRYSTNKIVEILLRHGADPNFKIGSSVCCLMMARTRKALGKLLKYGAKIELARNALGEPLIFQIIKSNNINEASKEKMIRLLMQYGESLNQILIFHNSTSYRKFGITPLTEAIKYSSDRLVSFLLNSGANPNLGIPGHYNVSFKTPLKIAKDKGYIEIERLLRNAGAYC